ncbi:MAG: methyltransferase domain-containing protein [Proteobacteria bacterium]|nr:methyltransferase domain-containing protein [Pseudomonadota bacterium]
MKGGVMTIRERRKRPRNQTEISDSAFIEIRHTFGPVRKSVYKVLEHDEHGMSFLVPMVDGYFQHGHPLEYSLVKSDMTKTDSYGAVKYYHPYNDNVGNTFYKVGIENKLLNGNRQPGGFRIRPERYKLAELEIPQAIHFFDGDREFSLPLVDISRYSAAFYFDEEDALSLSVSCALDDVAITFSTKAIFEGTVIVTRRDLEGDKYRIVIEPRNAIFDVDVIEEQESLNSVSRSVDTLVSEAKKYDSIDESFKAVVADMRTFLEGYSKILEMPMATKLSKESDYVSFLDELSKTFCPHLDAYVAKLDQTVNSMNLNERDNGLYKSYFQGHFHPLLMASPFCHRMYFKPLGYPGDYEMMRMIREEGYEGPTLFSKLINKHALQNPLATANRERVSILADRIASFVDERNKQEVRLLSVASGPALEIQKLVEERPEIASKIHITLLDQEAEALKYSQDSIYMKRIMRNSSIRVELVHQNIGSFLKQLARGNGWIEKYDMIYIFGLFDYFDKRMCTFCLNKVADLLEKNGKILISNYSLDGHHHRTYLEYGFEWYMVYRNAKQMEQLGRSVSAPCAIHVDEDSTGVIKFLELQF